MEAKQYAPSPAGVTKDVGTQGGCREDGGTDLGGRKRAKIANKKLQDYVTHIEVKKKSSSTHAPVSASSSSTPYPITHYFSCEKNPDKITQISSSHNCRASSEII